MFRLILLREFVSALVRRGSQGRVVLAALLLANAACGGPTGTSVASGGKPASQQRSTSVTFKVVVPAAHMNAAASRSRRPAYISPASRSITIGIDTNPVVAVDLTTTSPVCSSTSPTSPLTCALTFPVAPGTHTFNVITYDQTAALGSKLSANTGIVFTANEGSANELPITLQGIPASVLIAATANQDLDGDATTGFRLFGAYAADNTTVATRTFNVLPYDADGNLILGAGAPAVALTSSNPTTIQVTAPVVGALNPNAFKVTLGTGAYGTIPVQLTATATPPVASGGSAVTSTAVASFVARHEPAYWQFNFDGLARVFDEGGTLIATHAVTTPGSGVYDSHNGLLYLSDASVNSVSTIDESGATQAITLTTSQFPWQLAYLPATHEIAVGEGGPGFVEIFPETGGSAVTSFAVPSFTGISFDPSTGYFYLGSNSGTAYVYNRAGTQLAAVSLGLGDIMSVVSLKSHLVFYLHASAIYPVLADGALTPFSAVGGFPGQNGANGPSYDEANNHICMAENANFNSACYDIEGNLVRSFTPVPGSGASNIIVVP